MKKDTHSRSKKPLTDLEPRKSEAAVRGGRLSLAASSVQVSGNPSLLDKKEVRMKSIL